jgi:hypothetical protein
MVPSGPRLPHYRGFTITHFLDTSHSVGLLWTSDQPDTETSTWQRTTLTGFGPAIPASERPQTHALDRAASGIGTLNVTFYKFAYFSNIWNTL